MIKRNIKKRLLIASISMLILGITYIFPATNSTNNINQTLSYIEPNKTTIYLIDNKNMVARVNTIIKNSNSNDNDVETKAKNIINSLIINGDNSKYIPNGFSGIIPKNTKILSISYDKNILKINFNDEILKVPQNDEEKMIEALIYSLTELEKVNGIMIFINNNLLKELPNSNKILPDVLDRSYGINKIYNINDIKNTTKTTIYYFSKCKNFKYYTPVTYVTNDTNDKVEIIIERLKSSPINQTNLMSYLASNAELLDYQLLEDSINLSFNNAILNELDNKKIIEEVKYSIGLSLRDNFDVKSVSFNVNNEKIEDFSLNGLE